MRILVATDLSKGADEALRQGDAWARRSSGTLGVVHVMPDLVGTHTLFPQETAGAALDAANLEARVRAALEERVRAVTGREGAERFVDVGVDYARVLERAEAWKADGIVVGAHGHTAAERVLGGVAERIARYAHVEVLVARPSPARCVIGATDFSDPALAAVSAAAREARFFGVPLVVTNAVDTAVGSYFAAFGLPFGGAPPAAPDAARLAREAHQKLLEETLERVGASGEALVLEGSPARAIVRLAEERHAAMVVVATHGRTGLRRMALGSVAERVLRNAPCSVLVARVRS